MPFSLGPVPAVDGRPGSLAAEASSNGAAPPPQPAPAVHAAGGLAPAGPAVVDLAPAGPAVVDLAPAGLASAAALAKAGGAPPPARPSPSAAAGGATAAAAAAAAAAAGSSSAALCDKLPAKHVSKASVAAATTDAGERLQRLLPRQPAALHPLLLNTLVLRLAAGPAAGERTLESCSGLNCCLQRHVLGVHGPSLARVPDRLGSIASASLLHPSLLPQPRLPVIHASCCLWRTQPLLATR